ncbi:MAG: arsenate reductase [Xanthomonadales bacterium]|nr:arsenate reductase [Xanthomonadales bacterium]MDH4018736.1 arsenate reductase [Xanthomonadales bacterium]
MLTVYGIKQCDTVRKALKWLDQQGVEHQFHDFRTDGLQAELVKCWLDSEFAEKLLNRRSTTWRQLSDSQRQSDGKVLLELLLEHPTLIKRPVFVTDQIIAIGFNTAQLQSIIPGTA